MANSEGSYYPSTRHSTPRLSIATQDAETARADGTRKWSTPVNVPDWSRMKKKQQLEEECDGCRYDEKKDGFKRTPPHEFVAKRMSSEMMSFSVYEGVGRTLKGRDLSTLRNAIWKKTGFVD